MKTKLVIFGITGDLSRRKLLPALRQVVESGECGNLSIVGVSRHEVNVKELLETATGSTTLTDLTTIFTMDLAVAEDYVRLRQFLDLQEGEQALIYLAVPPSASASIVDFLGQAGLNTSQVKLLFEKPFGFDFASAKDFIARTGRYFEESQLYRIDHYMAKEVAAEVMRLRSNVDGREYKWGKETVASVEVVASESIGIEDRAVFYEQTGALRDFIQGHLMQLLSLVLMDVSPPFTMDDLAQRRLRALEALNPADPTRTVRAQFDGYQAEVSNPGSTTETFVSVALTSSDERWSGVPLRLTTGKNLDKKQSAVIIHRRDGEVRVFDEATIASMDKKLPDAYQRVLVEAIQGRKYIFTTSPEILRSWQIVAPIQENWHMDDAPLKLYAPGASVDSILHT